MLKRTGNRFLSGVNQFFQYSHSVPAVKGVSFGVGFKGVKMLASEYNDIYVNEKVRH